MHGLPELILFLLLDTDVGGGVDLGLLDEQVDGLADDHEDGLDDEEDARDGDQHGRVDEGRPAGVVLVGDHDPGQRPDEGRVDHEDVAGEGVEHEQVEDEEEDENGGEDGQGDVHGRVAIRICEKEIGR